MGRRKNQTKQCLKKSYGVIDYSSLCVHANFPDGLDVQFYKIYVVENSITWSHICNVHLYGYSSLTASWQMTISLYEVQTKFMTLRNTFYCLLLGTNANLSYLLIICFKQTKKPIKFITLSASGIYRVARLKLQPFLTSC
jgi:hypothetical protein